MNKKAYFGEFGGQFVPETLMTALTELEQAFTTAWKDPLFKKEFRDILQTYAGRPSLLYKAEQLSRKWGAQVYLKREDLNHTGAHKINNTLGQILLAKRMGKKKIIAETGAGQHGVATATVCALFNMECTVYMGKEDTERQSLNVFRMELMGAKVVPVTAGSMTLKDACSEALRAWVANVEDTYYILGSVTGPHPYPLMVREFQTVIGKETKTQLKKAEGRLPDAIIACVGGGSNAIGIFHPFINDSEVALIGVEAAGFGIKTGKHAASLKYGKKGVFQGSLAYVLQDEHGQVTPAHSISAGLDYPGSGPEHSWLADEKRAQYVSITDTEAVTAFQEVSKLEGIIPALESSHALAYAKKYCRNNKNSLVVVNLSGRGDKDVEQIKAYLEKKEGSNL